MGFELVPVWVEEIEGCAFAPVITPFPDVGGSQAFDEEREVCCVNAEGEMGVFGGGFRVAQWIEGKAQPKTRQREIGASVPRGFKLKLQQVVIERHAAVQVGDGEGQVVEACQQFYFLTGML